MFNNLKEEYSAAIAYAEGQLPAGENFQGMLIGMKKDSPIVVLLRDHVLGFLFTPFFPKRQMCGIAIAEKTVVFLYFKTGVIRTSYEPVGSFLRPASEISIKKGVSSCIVQTTDDAGKVLKVKIQTIGADKDSLNALNALKA